MRTVEPFDQVWVAVNHGSAARGAVSAQRTSLPHLVIAPAVACVGDGWSLTGGLRLTRTVTGFGFPVHRFAADVTVGELLTLAEVLSRCDWSHSDVTALAGWADHEERLSVIQEWIADARCDR